MTVEKFNKKQIKKYKWIELKFTDLMGNLHRLTLPQARFDHIMKHGVGFDSSSCAGFKSLEGGDMILLPDLNTIHISYNDDSTICFFCDIREADTKNDYERDPRSITRRAEKYMKKTGIADKAMFGPEFEFYLFDRVEVKNEKNITFAMIDLFEGNMSYDENINDTGEFLGKHNGYHSVCPKDQSLSIRNQISEILMALGIEVIYHHHEVGAGQNEIEIIRYPILNAAEYTQTIKNIIKTVAINNNVSATFMPKPMYNMPGSGMHFHQHLFKKGKNIFYDKRGYGGLSKNAEYYIAGLLMHGRALLAFTNPSTNSYKRLVPGFEAPVKLFYSLANRSSAIRIPKYATDKNEKRIEFRPPDATSNPYLACSAMLLAGLDGIKNKISLKNNHFGPYDMNMEKASNSIKNNIRCCPSSLDEALDALENDYKFLTIGNVFSADIIKAYIKYKRNEIRSINKRPHPYEFELYF